MSGGSAGGGGSGLREESWSEGRFVGRFRGRPVYEWPTIRPELAGIGFQIGRFRPVPVAPLSWPSCSEAVLTGRTETQRPQEDPDCSFRQSMEAISRRASWWKQGILYN